MHIHLCFVCGCFPAPKAGLSCFKERSYGPQSLKYILWLFKNICQQEDKQVNIGLFLTIKVLNNKN